MRQKITLLVALFVASVALVSGQTGRLGSVKVPFDFTVGDTVLPAGDYSVDRDSATLRISSKKGPGAVIPVVTRLAQLRKGSESFALVFDKAGERRFLSEVWMSGEDGFLVRRTSEKHSHEVLQKAE
ncbi:MAG: hypothetical protein EHM61_10140 [Acidobacteria bacterium]|nr:MAG: hypothetical protein EHM61_10140 [Acidobacteriota bacterium]